MGRKCMLCEKGTGTLKLWLDDCDKIEKRSMPMGKILHEMGEVELVEWLRALKRRKKEKRGEEIDGGRGRISIIRKQEDKYQIC